MKNTKIKRPTSADLYSVMKEICSVNNPWAFCISWPTEKPKLFNKFMDMCAYFNKDERFLSWKTKTTEFMHHKKLKKDVLVVSITPDEGGRICYLDTDTRMLVHDRIELFSAPMEHD